MGRRLCFGFSVLMSTQPILTLEKVQTARSSSEVSPVRVAPESVSLRWSALKQKFLGRKLLAEKEDVGDMGLALTRLALSSSSVGRDPLDFVERFSSVSKTCEMSSLSWFY